MKLPLHRRAFGVKLHFLIQAKFCHLFKIDRKLDFVKQFVIYITFSIAEPLESLLLYSNIYLIVKFNYEGRTKRCAEQSHLFSLDLLVASIYAPFQTFKSGGKFGIRRKLVGADIPHK